MKGKRVALFGIALFGLAFMMISCGEDNRPAAAAEQTEQQVLAMDPYDLGIRYLLEGNYEEAIIAFTAAIEIEPYNADLYIERAKAYLQLEATEENLLAAEQDYLKAIELAPEDIDAYLALIDMYIDGEIYEDYAKTIEIICTGLKNNEGDENAIKRLNEKIYQVLSGPVILSSDHPLLDEENLLALSEWTVGGVPIINATYDDYEKAYSTWDHGDYNTLSFYDEGVHAFFHEDGTPFYVEIGRVGNGQYVQPELRDVRIGDSFSDILKKVGFSDNGILCTLNYIEYYREGFSFRPWNPESPNPVDSDFPKTVSVSYFDSRPQIRIDFALSGDKKTASIIFFFDYEGNLLNVHLHYR